MPEAVFLFCKILSLVFLTYCVLQSISTKSCSGCLSNYASDENLVYEAGEEDSLLDDAVADDDGFDFSNLFTAAPHPFITLWRYAVKTKTLPPLKTNNPSVLSTRAPPILTNCQSVLIKSIQ